MTDLLSTLLTGTQRSFAVISRAQRRAVEVYAGDVVHVETLADIPLPASPMGPSVLAAVPFRQISERGFACHDDNAPLACLMINDHEQLPVSEVITRLPAAPLTITQAGFTTSDAAYAATVAQIIDNEISCGTGANFVIRRDYAGTYVGGVVDSAMALLRRLLVLETGAYWTFAFVTPDVALVGATPERHVSAHGGEVLMNPISGTYRHRPEGDETDDLLGFLADVKETEELFMVVDEELKMMAAVCEAGGQVLGPYLAQMGHLTHTEYLLRGESRLDVREILRRTMFAPTVTGSPVQSATRIISRYEPGGRGYYSGVLALLGRDEQGQTLDAPIMIRTCEFDSAGQFKVSVGATLVRDSDPDGEVAETHAKLAGLRQALGTGVTPAAHRPTVAFASDPRITAALAARNTTLAPFWMLRQPRLRARAAAGRVMIVDAEDDWTAMLAHQVRTLGMIAEIRSWTDIPEQPDSDVVLAGPGPGNPTSTADPRISALSGLIRHRLLTQMPLVAVCLSHQILAAHLGYPIVKLDRSHQGTQLQVDLFGVPQRVGFYNSFAALAEPGRTPGGVEVSADPDNGIVHALRGNAFASVQFHAESILTTNGIDVLESLIVHALNSAH